jgi:PAS domain S-box-containing protein
MLAVLAKKISAMLATIAGVRMPDEAPRDERLGGWSEQLYRNLVERVPAVVYIDSDDQRPDSLYLSPQVEQLLGHPPEAYASDSSLWYRQVHPDDAERVAGVWRAARERQGSFECEYRMIGAGGDLVWIRDGAVPVRDDSGEILCWQGVLYDITGVKQHEEELRAAREKYRALVENLPAVVYMVAPDDDRRTLYVSPQIELALGYGREEWLAQPDIWMELLHPDDREPTLAAHDLANETGAPWSREYRLIASDGRAVWFRDVATLVRDPQGRPHHWQGIQLDITELKTIEGELRRARDGLERRVQERTAELAEANALMALEIEERRRAESELADAERRYRALAEQIPAVTYTWVIGGEPTDAYTSPRIEQLLGYTPEEWDRSDGFWISRLHPDDRQTVLAATLRSEATGEPFSMEYRYLHRDGHIVWVQDEAMILSRAQGGRPWLFQGVMFDITARKDAEAKARASELRFQDLAEQVPGIIYVLDGRPDAPGFTFSYVGPQIREILGLEPEAWRTDEDWISSIVPEDRERLIALTAEVDTTGEPWLAEYRMFHADGHPVWVRDRGRVLERDPAGRPVIMQGLVEDVTEERRASERVEEAQERYRTLVEQIPAMVYIEAPSPVPDESHFLYLAPQVRSIIGYSVQEFMDDPLLFGRLLHPEDRDRVVAADTRAGQTGEPFDEEYRMIAKDGRTVWLHSRSVLIRDEAGRPRYWHGVALDVTEQRLAQESLRLLEQRYGVLTDPPSGMLGVEQG